MVTKRIQIPSADLSIGDTIRMGFTGCDNNSVTAWRNKNPTYLTRPGTQFQDFTYAGETMAFTSVNVCDGPGAGNIYIQNITQGKTLFTKVNQYFSSNHYHFNWFPSENPEPLYLERLTQLSTNTSHLTARSSKSL